MTSYTAEDYIREKNEEICRETADAMLFSQIRAEFGADAEEYDVRGVMICRSYHQRQDGIKKTQLSSR